MRKLRHDSLLIIDDLLETRRKQVDNVSGGRTQVTGPSERLIPSGAARNLLGVGDRRSGRRLIIDAQSVLSVSIPSINVPVYSIQDTSPTRSIDTPNKAETKASRSLCTSLNFHKAPASPTNRPIWSVYPRSNLHYPRELTRRGPLCP